MPNSSSKSQPPTGRPLKQPAVQRVAIGPPPTLLAGVAASFVAGLLAALVWHTRRPNAADAEMMRWQEVARVHADSIATAIATSVGPSVALAVLASAVLARLAGRWDAVVLALVAAPGTLLIEQLLKQVVHRQRPDGGVALLYPSGHVAAAVAAAMTVVLVLRVAQAPPRRRARVAWVASLLVVVIGLARLVQTVHYVTDVVGGAAVGLAVTCWAALAISALCRSGRLVAARHRPPGRTRRTST